MLTAESVLALIAAGESATLEFKQNLPKDQILGETICAFANDINATGLPSYLLLGVRNDGSVCGVDPTDTALQRLAQLRTDGCITPTPSMTVEVCRLGEGSIIALKVEPSDSPPVRRNGSAFVRVGAVTTRATPEEERLLVEHRRGRAVSPDLLVVAGTSLADLDLPRFQIDYLKRAVSPEVLAENNRSVEQQLAALKMIDGSGRATITGLLSIGIDPRFWLPMAYIQFRRVAGTQLTDDTIDQAVIHGTLDVMSRQIEEKLNAHNFSPLKIGEKTHQTFPAYPLAALRQIVRNAIMHRDYNMSTPIRVTWYDDRVEMISPGGPWAMPPERLGEPGLTSYRNPNIAEAMHNLGLVERFGVGLPLAAKALAQNGNPPLELKVDGNFVFAVMRLGTDV